MIAEGRCVMDQSLFRQNCSELNITTRGILEPLQRPSTPQPQPKPHWSQKLGFKRFNVFSSKKVTDDSSSSSNADQVMAPIITLCRSKLLLITHPPACKQPTFTPPHHCPRPGYHPKHYFKRGRRTRGCRWCRFWHEDHLWASSSRSGDDRPD